MTASRPDYVARTQLNGAHDASVRVPRHIFDLGTLVLSLLGNRAVPYARSATGARSYPQILLKTLFFLDRSLAGQPSPLGAGSVSTRHLTLAIELEHDELARGLLHRAMLFVQQINEVLTDVDVNGSGW